MKEAIILLKFHFLPWIVFVCGLSIPATNNAYPYKYYLFIRVLQTVEALVSFDPHVFLIFFRFWKNISKYSRSIMELSNTQAEAAQNRIPFYFYDNPSSHNKPLFL